jgi:hypothetical protein
MDLIRHAMELANGDHCDEKTAAVVYALAAVVGQLESIDDALRNTVGGVPR